MNRTRRHHGGITSSDRHTSGRLDARGVDYLLASAKAGPTLFARGSAGEIAWCLTGLERWALYQLVLETGISEQEASCLTPESLDLAGDLPALHIALSAPRSRRAQRLPVSGVTAAIFRELLQDRPSGVPIFEIPNGLTLDRVVAFDAAVADLPDPGTITFASLRHFFLESAGKSKPDKEICAWSDRAVELLPIADPP